MGEELALTVTHVGADGDGVALLPDGTRAYLPYTLPGETVTPGPLARRGQGWTAAAAIVAVSPERRAPPCPHFGACGGCTLQHWQDEPYAAWKIAQVRSALTRAGYAAPALAPLARTGPSGRRRVDLALERDGAGVRVGLHRHRGRDVIDLQTCLVLEPALVTLIAALRSHLPGISGLRRAGSAIANQLDSGVDLLLRTDGQLSPGDRSKLSALAQVAGVCRVSWAKGDDTPELASQIDPALLTLSGAALSPPAGAFLQASRQGEAAIVQAVLAGLPRPLPARARVIELFAGCGTLSFALAAHARVTAYEGDAAAASGLRRAVAGRALEVRQRDLARQPLSAKELASAVAVLLDPPFAGAAAQMPALASSGVPRIIYVSCNPAALARDAGLLRAAGYELDLATPIDQFLWSAAVESVCVFSLAKRRSEHRSSR